MRALERIFLLVLSMVFMKTNAVSAGVFPLADSGWAMVTNAQSQGLSVPAVDKVGDAVVIELRKTFTGTVENGFSNPISFEFQKITADAVTNIIIKDEYIINETNAEWFDFHIALMVDSLHPEAGFDTASTPDGHQFEDVQYSMNFGYDNLPILLSFIDADGSGVPFDPPGHDVFRPGAVSGQIVITTDPLMPIGEKFGIEEVASVPEPATLALFAAGALMTYKQKRKR